MDKKIEILLGSKKNIKSTDVDNFNKIELSRKTSTINEYDVRNVLSVTDVFDAEREANQIYRIYGRIEYLSLLNGIKNDYGILPDFFTKYPVGTFRSIVDSFNFYMVMPTTATTLTQTSSTLYTRKFKVLAKPYNFEIFPAGFSNNVYNEQTYAFSFSVDFDVSDLVDGFGFPLTELYIYAEYIPRTNVYNTPELMYYTKWNSTGSTRQVFTPTSQPIEVGNTLVSSGGYPIMDIVEYGKSQFYQSSYSEQVYYISTPYLNITRYYGNSYTYENKQITWNYKPLIPIRLRYFANQLNQVNTGTTVYDETNRIPYYATNLGGGNFVWRDILPQGYTDPTSGLGVDYPFINKRRYLFTSIILDVTPDLTDSNTWNVFKNIKYSTPTVLNTSPSTDLNNIGKPCQ